ncbi:MAG: sarcosine oxidase subunit gamma family protein [Sneathiella sp.]
MVKLENRMSPASNLKEDFPTCLRELIFRGQLNLRGNPENKNFMTSTKSVLGLDLPLSPNTVSTGSGIKALWLSPDEWLVVAEDQKQNDLVWKLEKALIGEHSAINDVSANRTIFEITGENAHQVLMKSSEFDFHPRVFSPDNCVQTLIAKSQVIVEQTEPAAFHIYVRCSFGRYVGAWLAEACQEFV